MSDSRQSFLSLAPFWGGLRNQESPNNLLARRSIQALETHQGIEDSRLKLLSQNSACTEGFLLVLLGLPGIS